jgi:hypothetical protein
MDILMTLANVFTYDSLLYSKARSLVVRGKSIIYISKNVKYSTEKNYHFCVKFDSNVNNYDMG